MRELFREFAAENGRRRDAVNRDTRLAWQIVRIWAHTKTKNRLPKLETLLVTRPREAGEPVRSYAQHRAALEVLSAQYGIPLTFRTRAGRESSSHAK